MADMDTSFLGNSFSDAASDWLGGSTGGDNGWSWGGGGMDNGDIFSGGNYGGGNFGWDPGSGGFSDYYANGGINSGSLYEGGQDLNSMYGESLLSADPGYGRTQYSDSQQNDLAYNSLSPYEKFQAFFKRNPGLRMLLSLHPAGRAINVAAGGYKGIGGFLGSMFGGQQAGLGGALLGGWAGSRLGETADKGTTNWVPTGQEVGSTLGSIVGGNLSGGNPFGSMIGGQIGSQIGGQVTGNTMPTNISPVTGVSNSAGLDNVNQSLLGAAAGLYNYGARNSEVNKQIGGLEALYSANSPYAQQMRQAMERKDAAAGRRSQYGTREVELQAALATQASRMAPTLQQLYQQKQNQRGMALNSLLRNPEVARYLSNGLGSLFGQTATPASYGMEEWSPGYSMSNPAMQEAISGNNGFGYDVEGWGG